MALDDLLSKERIDKISEDFGLGEEKVKSFGIDPKSSYDSDEFVKRANSLFDLDEHYNALRQNINDMDALGDVVKDIIPYIPAPEIMGREFFQNPHAAIAEADNMLSKGQVSLAKFVENNRRTMLEKLDEKDLYGLFQRTPSYATGNQEYDRAKNLKEKIMKMAQAQKEGQDITEFVKDDVDKLIKGAGEDQAEFIKRYENLIRPRLTERIITDIQREFASLFRNKEGKYDKSKLIDYLEANYKVVEDEIKDADNDRDKNGLWDKNLKQQYLAIAQILLGNEKKRLNEEKDPEREKWKKDVKSKGLRI